MSHLSGRTKLEMAGLLLALSASGAWAQPADFDMGKYEYEGNCAVCHGVDGKGNGPYRQYLAKAPSDLTTLAKRNDGVFPSQQLYETIDGRRELAEHGPRAMPIWGSDYRMEGAAQPRFAYQPEAFVRARIIALIDYLHRLQVK